MSDNRYEVLGKIADGGLGSVYKAYDRNLRREVALKRVRAETEAETERQAEALMDEARNLSALQHPHIVTIYDVGRDEDGAYLVMELLKGETLEDLIERGALDEASFRQLATQSLEGMIAAHGGGMIHLDIKPQNLMFIWLPSGKFQVKILDFGLAKIAHQPLVQETDDDGAIMGSIYFMTPEQFERSPVDARTDLYSLGCVYYYALTQNYPFQGETGPEVMASHMYHSHIPLEQLRPDLPPFIHNWVEWLMSRLPDDRPADATTAYESFLQGRFPGPLAGAEVISTAIPAQQIPGQNNVQRISRPGSASAQLRPTAPRPQRPIPTMTRPVRVGRPAGVASGPLSNRPVPKPMMRPINIAAAAAPKHLKSKKPLSKWITLGLPFTLIALVGGFFFVQTQIEAAHIARLQDLSTQDKPQGVYTDVPMLLKMLEDPGTSDAAGAVLGKMQGVDAADDMLTNNMPRMKSDIAKKNLTIAIGARSIHDAVTALVAQLGSSPTPDVRLATWNALARTGQVSDISEILSKMMETTGDELHAAEQAVTTAARTEPDADKRSQPVVQAVKANSGSDDLQAALLHILGRLGGNNGYDELSKALKNSNIKIRTAAVSALADWPTGEALGDLIALLSAEKSGGVRSVIINTIGRLAARASSVPQADIAQAFSTAYAATKDNREQTEIINALGRVTDPTASLFLENTVATEPKRKRIAQIEAKNVDKLLEHVSVVTSGSPLDIGKAELNGPLIRKDGVIFNWPGLGDNANWALKIEQPGSYEIKLTQSFNTATPGRYIVAFGKEQLKNKVEKTASATDFKTITIGKVSIAKPGIYHLWIIPVEIAPGESLMRLKEVVLTKSGA